MFQVKEAAMSFAKGEKNKDLAPYISYLKECSQIQRDVVYWIHTKANETFTPSAFDFKCFLHRVFWIDPPDQFWSLDNWPPENERAILVRLAQEIPVLEDTLLRIAVVGHSRDVPFKNVDALDLVDTLVRRCSAMKTAELVPSLVIENVKFADILFG
jgi:integrator complex subunit 1